MFSVSEYLRNNPQLTTITLSQIELAGVRVIGEDLKKPDTILTSIVLQNCRIGNDGAREISDALATNSTLKNLSLVQCDISSSGAEAIADDLNKNSTLTSLDLSFNGINDQGLIAIAKTLKTHKTLTTFRLRSNHNPGGLPRAIVFALKTNTALTTIDLGGNRIDDDVAVLIAEVLKTNSTLTGLGLSGCGISDKGVREIVEALKTNKTLTRLSLSECKVSAAATMEIAKVLEVNTTLKTLDLSSNAQIGADGVKAISEVLKTNKTLFDLDLSGCALRREIVGLAEALKENTTLARLGLANNGMDKKTLDGSTDDKAAKALAEMLETNLTLIHLDVGVVSDEGALAIAKAIIKLKSSARALIEIDAGTERHSRLFDQAIEINKMLSVYLGHNQKDHPLSVLPLDVMRMVQELAVEHLPLQDSDTLMKRVLDEIRLKVKDEKKEKPDSPKETSASTLMGEEQKEERSSTGRDE
ncbi:MAG: hypothetical protein V4612_00215 [Pseudomonadota bacterium]